MSSLKNDVSGLKDDVSGVKNDVSGLKDDVSGIKQGQERLESKVDNLSLEVRSNFKYTNDKINDQYNVFEIVSSEIKSTKVDIEYLSSKAGKHDTELNNIMSKLKD
ncbi:hypothetical protein [Aquibacillus sediminis]|uniref:hypothetical protein n=1 Tax=Aquibacillus sediminis TaxID=2574734 RepID=UPI001FE4FCB2|nr:hypothetical protein [Aquibacillus sediminis]